MGPSLVNKMPPRTWILWLPSHFKGSEDDKYQLIENVFSIFLPKIVSLESNHKEKGKSKLKMFHNTTGLESSKMPLL